MYSKSLGLGVKSILYFVVAVTTMTAGNVNKLILETTKF